VWSAAAVLQKMSARTVVTALPNGGKETAGKLVALPVKGNALAAVAAFVAGGIGAAAVVG